MNKIPAGPPVLDKQPEAPHERDLYGNRISTEYTTDFSSFGDDDIDAFFDRGYIAFERAFSSDQVRDAQSCLLYTSPSPRDGLLSRMPSSA